MKIVLAIISHFPIDTALLVTLDKFLAGPLASTTVFARVALLGPPIAILIIAIFGGRMEDESIIAAVAFRTIGCSEGIVLRLVAVRTEFRHCSNIILASTEASLQSARTHTRIRGPTIAEAKIMARYIDSD